MPSARVYANQINVQPAEKVIQVDICRIVPFRKIKGSEKWLFWLLHHTCSLWAIRKHFNCHRKAPVSEVVAPLTHLCCCQFLTQFLIRCHLAHFPAFCLVLLPLVLWGTTWFGINSLSSRSLAVYSHWAKIRLSRVHSDWVKGLSQTEEVAHCLKDAGVPSHP